MKDVGASREVGADAALDALSVGLGVLGRAITLVTLGGTIGGLVGLSLVGVRNADARGLAHDVAGSAGPQTGLLRGEGDGGGGFAALGGCCIVLRTSQGESREGEKDDEELHCDGDGMLGLDELGWLLLYRVLYT